MAELPAQGEVVLDADESRHLVRSRRVAEGEVVVLFDGKGGSRFATVLDADPRGTRLELGGDAPDREPRHPLTLVVSPPEGGRADDLVGALAELGVTRLAWVETARTPPRRLASTARRLERQQRRAREAAKINGRSRVMDVVSVGALEPWLAAQAPASVLLLDPDPGQPGLLEALAGQPTRSHVLVVGPEGGFTPEECALAASAGHGRARLGTCVLRVGTAALAAAATVRIAEG